MGVQKAPQRPRIVIVEDDSVVVRSLENRLKAMGCEIAGVAASGEEAVALIDQAKPDLVLMDIVLQGELDGIEAARRLMARDPVPVVFLTAYADEDKLQRAKMTRPYGYILKPFQNRDLEIGVEMALYAAELDARRHRAEEALKTAHDEMEDRVRERTAELESALEALKEQVAERRRAEDRLRSLIDEKEILLRELHHRVKNSMQVISSLLSLQSDRVKDSRVVAALQESQQRVAVMALVHEILHRADVVNELDFGQYIDRLLTALSEAYGASANRIDVRVEAEDVRVSIDHAMPCGLVLNELISNALKHGFPSGGPGEIVVGVRRLDGGVIECRVRDNGTGLPEGMDWRSQETLGLSLVIGLVERQLKGRIEVKTNGGTEFILSFQL